MASLLFLLFVVIYNKFYTFANEEHFIDRVLIGKNITWQQKKGHEKIEEMASFYAPMKKTRNDKR